MPASESVGRIIPSDVVERALIGRYRGMDDQDQPSPAEPGYGLKGWMAYYGARIDDEHGQVTPGVPMPPIASWWTARDARRGIVVTNLLPALVVMVADDDPLRDTNGKLNTSYRAIISVRTAADSPGNARVLSGRYLAAMRASLLRHPTIGGLARSIEPGRGEYDLFPTADEGDYRASAVAEFTVFVRDTLTTRRADTAPDAPPNDPSVPPGPLPPVPEEADITVTLDEEQSP